MKRVTIKDIAKKLGVANSTISMAIHNDRTISRKMKDKVNRAIKEMGYYPNRAASNLVKGLTNNIAVVTPGLFSLYEMYIVRGMEQQMLESSYDLVLYTARYDWKEVHNELRKILYTHTADAVIVLGVLLKDEILEEFKKVRIPLVNVDGGLNKKIFTLNIDNYKCGAIAAEHFTKIGKKKPSLILGNTEFAFSQAERLRGYKETIRKKGLNLSKDLTHESPEYLPQDLKNTGYEAAKILIEKGADSIYCASGDFAAQGAFKYCSDNNIEMPGQVSIIGTDNFDVADALNFSSIQQPLMEMGKRAFETAEKAIKNKMLSGKSEFFRPKLIIRKT